jgi:hypothetical protein
MTHNRVKDKPAGTGNGAAQMPSVRLGPESTDFWICTNKRVGKSEKRCPSDHHREQQNLPRELCGRPLVGVECDHLLSHITAETAHRLAHGRDEVIEPHFDIASGKEGGWTAFDRNRHAQGYQK